MMFMLGIEPDAEDALQDEKDRDAAREFMAEAQASDMRCLCRSGRYEARIPAAHNS
jgi:hypothetical protein